MKKRLLVITLLTLAALLFAACGDDAEPAGQTFTSTDTPMDVPGDGSYANSYITVSGGPASISKITVKVRIPHTNTLSLAIELFGPHYTSGTNGATALAYYNGANGVSGGYIDVVFDDNADNPIEGATMQSGGFTGPYRPELSFHTFLGASADGQWYLHVKEDVATSVNGQIESWSITFE